MNPLLQHFRYPQSAMRAPSLMELSEAPAFFKFSDRMLFGKTSGATLPASEPPRVAATIDRKLGVPVLPFDSAEVVDNLRLEKYVSRPSEAASTRSFKRRAYYALRPLLPFSIRTQIKKWVHRGWREQAFPSWPVDSTVDDLLLDLLAVSMAARGLDKLPFIWFWPRNHSACMLMTHDVEAQAGLDHCERLMDINDEYGVRASFQLVPEQRYRVTERVLDRIVARGNEVAVHDWNHDGQLYSTREVFLERAAKINDAARRFGAKGFRAGALYRNLEWYDAFEFSYDMSVPNVGHLDPQPGGCCTVMPYFVGNILELPVTMTQDYMLFHLMGQYSIEHWKQQFSTIADRHGVASFIVHPDYLIDKKAESTYRQLLAYLAAERQSRNLWFALPREVDAWWRQRSQMNLVEKDGRFEIVGEGSENASIAWAVLERGKIRFILEATGAVRQEYAESALGASTHS